MRGRAGQKPCVESRLQGGSTLRPLRSLFTGSAALSLSMAHLWKSRRHIRLEKPEALEWGKKWCIFLYTVRFGCSTFAWVYDLTGSGNNMYRNQKFNIQLEDTSFFKLDCYLRQSLHLDNKQDIKKKISLQSVLISLTKTMFLHFRVFWSFQGKSMYMHCTAICIKKYSY